jgi:hypothetical protein
MWNIRLLEDNSPSSSYYDYMGHQMHEKHIDILDSSLDYRSCEDYKKLNHFLEEHIVKYINEIPFNTIDLFVYNYGIDNAIALLNEFNNKKKFINTSSKSLLFAIFYNRFSIYYIPNADTYTTNYTRCEHSTIIIQRFWRRVLVLRKKLKKNTIDAEISYLIVKINKEIVGESTRKVLTYMVNKFRSRLNRILRL